MVEFVADFGLNSFLDHIPGGVFAVTEFRVVDLMDSEVTTEFVIEAASPEAAAKKALGVDLVRSAHKSLVRAKVYFCHPGAIPSMVRLYVRAADRDRLKAKFTAHVDTQV